MWTAALASNVGTWMHTVAAAWLMTSLSPSPLLTALVQTATTLPVFLLSLPAGALAYLIDRRRLLLFTQSWMLAAAAVMGALALMGFIGPWWLLALTFALGIGSTMNGPAWSATVPELVPRDELPAAVSLNSVGFNIARAIGPALGGLVLAASSAGVVFILNAISFLGVILVLWSWRNEHAPNSGDEKLLPALHAGWHYVRQSRIYHAVLIRAGLFSLAGSALWAMLPVVAKQELASSSMGYGILLGCLGTGSVTGAAILAPLRARYSVDRVLAWGVMLFASATAGLALFTTFTPVAVSMFGGGIAWITVMSSMNVCAQTAPPTWVRARALAFYLLVFQGGLAIGSSVWGAIANRFGVRVSLLIAAGALAAGLITGLKLRLDTWEREQSSETISV
jgi:MFS family permease